MEKGWRGAHSTAHPFGLWAKVGYFVVLLSPHATTFGVRGYSTASQGSLYRPPGECYGKRKSIRRGITLKIKNK